MDWIDRRAVVKDVFEMSLGGMVEAIDEVQRRGDSMMSGIKKQRELLAGLKAEIRDTRGRLVDIDRKLEDLANKQAITEEDTDNAEKDAERINKLKVRIKETVKKMEKYKSESEDTLRLMETEIEHLVVEMEEKKPQLARLGLELVPMTDQVDQTRTELISLTSHMRDKSDKFHKVQSELALSNTQLSHLKARITSLSNLPLASIDKKKESIFSSTPPMVPALVVSTMLNMITGATLLSKFMVTTTNNLERIDTLEQPDAHQLSQRNF